MKSKPYRIAVLLPVEAEYSDRLLEGAIQYVGEHPEVTLIEMPYRQGSSPLPDGALEFDGAFVWPYPNDTWIERLLDEEIPLLSASPNWVNRGVAQIAFHGQAVEKMAFEHLAALGHQQIAYIGINTSSGALAYRRKRFFDRATEDGFDVVPFEIEPPEGINSIHRIMKLGESGELLGRFLADLPKPASVWCDDDYVARLVCDHAEQEGLQIPRDLAVLGLGDFSVSRSGSPSISTIPQPGQLVGRQAIEVIQKTLAGEPLKGLTIPVPPPPVLERESTTGKVRAEEAYRRAFLEIRGRACEGLSVAELAGMLQVSKVTFSKHFSELFGCTPGEEIRRIKIERAKHYLKNTDDSIERVAQLCGFEDSGNFSKFFKRQSGQTASKYRKGKSRS